MIDACTKVVLTVIAVALLGLGQQLTRPAVAGLEGCGGNQNAPCYIADPVLETAVQAIPH
jgi:hypothetical protein